jgi:hypothetical protein
MRGYKWKSLLSWLPMVCAASEKYNCHPACNCWLIQWETLVLAKPLQKSCCSWNLSRKVSSSSSCMFLWDVYHCFFNAFVMISIIYIYISYPSIFPMYTAFNQAPSSAGSFHSRWSWLPAFPGRIELVKTWPARLVG